MPMSSKLNTAGADVAMQELEDSFSGLGQKTANVSEATLMKARKASHTSPVPMSSS